MIALVNDVQPGVTCYLAPGDPRWGTPKDWQRSWSWHGALRSVKRRDGGMTKTWAPFQEHGSPAAMSDLLTEMEARGLTKGPSGYGDLFHALHDTPPVQAHVRKLFPAVPGAWEMAIQPGRNTQPLFMYDIRSAYLWSFRQGLPSPHSFVTVKKMSGPGLYLVRSPCHPALPYPWCASGQFPATDAEISCYSLDASTVTRGIAFAPDTWTTTALSDSIGQWSCWKAVGKRFWGRWASAAKSVQTTYDKLGNIRTETPVRNPLCNPVWAAIITSRIRMRLWDMVWRLPVLRVYVDSIVTTEPIATGEAIGEWREVKYYPKGGIIGTGGVHGNYETRAA